MQPAANRVKIKSKPSLDDQCCINDNNFVYYNVILYSRCAYLLYYKHEGDEIPDTLEYYKEINIAQVCIVLILLYDN